MTSSSPPFRRPLGLVLAGGGALGSWQAAALAELERAGVAFDAVLGFSAGALNGAFYAAGRTTETLERWRRVDGGVLRFAPRLFPLSLCSDRPLRAQMEFFQDDAAARAAVRRRLVVLSARRDRSEPIYGIFDPAAGRWDGPIASHLLASCAIPRLFPAVRLGTDGASCLAFDGGCLCARPVDFGALGPARDVLVLEMMRPEELLERPSGLWRKLDWSARAVCRRIVDDGLASLAKTAAPPRVFRLVPSRALAFTMLDFSAAAIGPALELGKSDAAEFLAQQNVRA